MNSQIHHQKFQEPLKNYQAIYPNSVHNRILVAILEPLLSAFLQRIFGSAKFIFGIINLKNNTDDGNNSHVTGILQ